MGYWTFGRTAVFALVLVGLSGGSAFALGTWECVAVDGAYEAPQPGSVEATLSKKFFVTDDGAVHIVDVVIETPQPARSGYKTIVDALLTRLGVHRPLIFADRVARIDEGAKASHGVDWALSPRKPAGRDAWQPAC